MLLLLLAAARLPLPPAPPTQARSRAAAEEALKDAETHRLAALAAEQRASERAAAAAATRDKLAAARVQAAARLEAVEKQSGKIARGLDALSDERAAAERALEKKKRAFAPLLPLLERISLYPAVTFLAVPEPPEQALRGVLVIREMARHIEAEAAAIAAQQQRVAALAQEISAEMPELAAAEKRQRAAAAALDAEIATAKTEEKAARGEAGAAAAMAAHQAGREKTLKRMIAAIAEAARRRAAEEAAARAEAKREAAQKKEEVALARPPAPPAGRVPGQVVAGMLVSRFGAPTPAGPALGVRYATAPGAHVLAPCGGLVEFAAPFRSYGRLVILDCGHGERFVLAGMQKLLVQAGATVAAGEVLGVMADWDPGGRGKRPTLYVEFRRGGVAVDPLPRMRAKG